MANYELYCERESIVLNGPNEIDISAEVKKALSELSDDDLLSGDWWNATIEGIIKNNPGFTKISITELCDVEDEYWHESMLRQLG